MAELLLITPQELTKDSIIGGNVDIDKYNYVIHKVQLHVIEPLLGSELYEKIKTDFAGAGLSGLYLEMYNKFIKPIIKHQAVGEYIEIASYTVDNGGIYTHQAENEIVPDRKEIENFANDYRSTAQVYVQRFYKWICKNDIPEYKTYQDEVNASKDVGLTAGWFFGSSQDLDKWGEKANCSKNCNCLNRCDGCIS